MLKRPEPRPADRKAKLPLAKVVMETERMRRRHDRTYVETDDMLLERFQNFPGHEKQIYSLSSPHMIQGSYRRALGAGGEVRWMVPRDESPR